MTTATATAKAMAATPKTNPKSSPTTAKSLTTAAAIAAAAAASISPSPPPSPSPSPPPPPPHTPATARRRPPGRTAAAAVVADPLSDKATILLIRRTLCADDVGQPAALGHGQPPAPVSTAAQPQALTPTPTPTPTATATTSTISIAPTTSIPTTTTSATPPPQTPIEELLPPLTSRNDVDLQLYALLAVVVREFVQTWYCRITTDSQLATEIVHIFAHCTRALEQRLRKADLEGLVFDELPALLDNHVQDPRVVYHALLPLPALEPVPSAKSAESVLSQAANESAYRQLLVSGLLAVLLPTEDLENECLTSLLSQILSELLLGNVLAGRVAEPWMMWEIVGMLARLLREKIDGENNNTLPNSTTKLPQKLRSPSLTPPPTPSPSSFSALSSSISLRFSSFSSTITPLFWSALRIGFALYASLRFLVASIGLARSLPPRQLQFSDQSMPAKNSGLPVAHSAAHLLPSPPPVLAYSLWPAVANLVEFNVRMPWLSGCLSMVQWLALTGPGRIGAFNGPLDRLLSYYLRKYALDAALLPALLRSMRSAVFPGNKFGATPPTLVAPANAHEEKALRRRTAEAVWAVANGNRAASEATLADIDGVLDVFSDAYCNKHLLYGLLEAILVRLLPEMADTGVLGLWEERLS